MEDFGAQAMKTTISTVIEPLLKRKIFNTEEEAVRELVKKYILQQINSQKREISRLEKKYGMPLNRFREYLHETLSSFANRSFLWTTNAGP